MDASFVSARIATGAALNGIEDVQWLVDHGVNYIIDCRGEFDDSALIGEWMMKNPHHRLRLLWNGTEDDGTKKSPEWFHKSVSFALRGLAAEHGCVYAHCAAGVNRGPSTCYAILRSLGLPPDVAEQQIRLVRPQVGLAYKADADRAFDLLYAPRHAPGV